MNTETATKSPRKRPPKAFEPTEAALDGVFDGLRDAGPDAPRGGGARRETVPNIGSDEWTPYVMSKLRPYELCRQLPTYNGLRRLCYELLGDIVDTDVRVAESFMEARVTIEHPAEFVWLGTVAGRTVRYSHLGDSVKSAMTLLLDDALRLEPAAVSAAESP